MSKKITPWFRLKFFFEKRIQPKEKIRWDIKATLWGYRKKKYAEKYGEPIDLQGKQHIHLYHTMICGKDCYFCQNKYYVDSFPKYDYATPEEWAFWVNRFYNFNHLDLNGGDIMFYDRFWDFFNLLDHHNIEVFTTIPRNKIPLLYQIDTTKNNIHFAISFHPLNEKREIYQFVQDFKKVPKGLNPTMHVLGVPEVHTNAYVSAFARHGIYCYANTAFTPTEHNKITDKYKTALCRSDMDCINPELKVYRCLGLMLRDIGGKHISKYKFSNEPQWCSYYGLCGPCSMQKDVYEIR